MRSAVLRFNGRRSIVLLTSSSLLLFDWNRDAYCESCHVWPNQRLRFGDAGYNSPTLMNYKGLV
jgi:hypothetical protein